MKTILILAANPNDTTQLRLDEEVREIDSVLRRARRRDDFNLQQRWAVRSRDVQAALLDCSPQIVHFSGHGAGTAGLVLEDETGQGRLVDAQALAGLFRLFTTQIECVILNACYSEVQADAIAQHLKYVIGMNQPIGDKAAIEFAFGFYNALGAGRSYEDAFAFGGSAIQMAGIAEFQTPVLKVNPALAPAAAAVETAFTPLQEGQLAELHEEYDAYNEEVKALKKAWHIEDLAPRQRLTLQRQIREAEANREAVARKIEALKKECQG